jgi:hypothetical protein
MTFVLCAQEVLLHNLHLEEFALYRRLHDFERDSPPTYILAPTLSIYGVSRACKSRQKRDRVD